MSTVITDSDALHPRSPISGIELNDAAKTASAEVNSNPQNLSADSAGSTYMESLVDPVLEAPYRMTDGQDTVINISRLKHTC